MPFTGSPTGTGRSILRSVAGIADVLEPAGVAEGAGAATAMPVMQITASGMLGNPMVLKSGQRTVDGEKGVEQCG